MAEEAESQHEKQPHELQTDDELTLAGDLHPSSIEGFRTGDVVRVVQNYPQQRYFTVHSLTGPYAGYSEGQVVGYEEYSARIAA